MRRALALVLAALHLVTLAAPVDAKYLNKTTGVDTGNALNPQAPWKTVAYANAQLPADSTIYFAANDTVLDVAINPVNPGTFWMGDSVTPANCRVPGATINKPFTTVRGFRVVGSLQTGSTGIYAHVRKSHVVGGTSLNKRGGRLEYNRLGTGQSESSFMILPNPGDRDSFTIKNNSMNLFYQQASGIVINPLLKFQPSTYSSTMKDWVVEANTCTLTLRSGQIHEKSLFLGALRRARFYNNSWLFRDSSGYSGGNQAWVLRDSVKECKFINETIELRELTGNGIGQLAAFLYSSGANLPCSLNSWKFCTFKSNVARSPAFHFQPPNAYRDSFYRNTVICSRADPCFQVVGAKDSLFIYRNTLVNTGGGRAFALVPTENNASAWGSSIGRATLSGNIYYNVGGLGATIWNVPDFTTGLFLSDRNLYFAPTVNGQDRAWAYDPWSSGNPAAMMRVGQPNSFSLELNSTWGSPLFADSSYSTFDGNLSFVSGVASYAKATGPSGVDCGALDYVGPPPEDVDDLQSQGGTSDSVTLVWIAPGENGDVGTATSYDIRYSTAEITDQNFTSATEATGEPAPSVAGTFETFKVGGLTANTTYYFAMRTSNSSRSSNTSNCVSERTWPSGTIEP